ncbi:MAG: hypothetical protein LRY24_02330 [Erysipelotrichaceae bacterium]|nr:hypothetical protein [Erysipelotrichaceae bacterium]
MERIVNKIQALIFKHKNTITFISGTLILVAYASSFLFKNDELFTFALIIASMLGVLPIALQAIQALKVKVISIDVLVTVAVIAAFLIQEYPRIGHSDFLVSLWILLRGKTP